MSEEPFYLTISKPVIDSLQDIDKVIRLLKEGVSNQQLLNIPDSAIAPMYREALSLFHAERYTDAMHAFLLLAFLVENNHDIWLGLGMSLQMTKRYENAINAYELAAICELENPVPYFYLAKCLFAIHDLKGALEAIDMAIEYAGASSEYEELLHQAQAAKQSLLKHHPESKG